MKRSARILRRALDDLVEIHRYIERDRPIAADRVIGSLLDLIASLERFPDRGRVPRDLGLRSRGFRVLVEAEYLVFYKVLRTNVRVYRVIHGRRRYEHLL